MKKPNILEILRSNNVCELLDDDKLDEIGKSVCERYQKDKETMSEWESLLEKGHKLDEPADGPKNSPLPNGSNYKATIISDAVVEFGDRATVEILGESNLVSASAEGQETPELKERINRVTRFMNFQYNTEQRNYREQTSGLMYELARNGVVFRKTYYDPEKGHNCSTLIRYPNFAVDNCKAVGDELDCFTELKDYSENEKEAKIKLGIWRKCDIEEEELAEDDDDDSIDMDDDDESKSSKSECKYIEQHTWLDLDDDDVCEPYIITVHRPSAKVVRIVARFGTTNIIVKTGPGKTRPFPQEYNRQYNALLNRVTRMIQSGAEETQKYANLVIEKGEEALIKKISLEALKDVEIINIKADDIVVKYDFVNNPKGEYLGYGFSHILGSRIELINTTTNQVVDAATLQNIPGGFKSKEVRNTQAGMSFAPGMFKSVDVSADVLSKAIMQLPFKGPSPYLTQFLDTVKAETQQQAQRISLEGVIAPNAPASTTLALIAEKLTPTTARFKSVLTSMGREFNIMYRLNEIYTDPELYAQVCNLNPNQGEIYAQDFESQSRDVIIKATGNALSKSEKLHRAKALFEVGEQIVTSGGDMRPILEEVFNSLDATQLYAKVFPDPNSMTPQQQQALAQQQAMQQQMLQQQQLSNQISQAQLQEQQTKNQLQEVKLQQEQQKIDREDRKLVLEWQHKVAQLQMEEFNSNMDAQATLAQAEKYLAEANKTQAETQSEAVKRAMEVAQFELEEFKDTVNQQLGDRA